MQWEEKKQQIKTLIEAVISLLGKYQMNDLAKDASGLLGDFDQEKFYVIICGEFKRGKSTLINAYLEEENLCPVNVDIATNMITSIRHGSEERVMIYFMDDKTAPLVVTRSEVANFVTEQGNRNNWKKVREVAVEIPSNKLSSGVILYDTPGVGALNKEHTLVSYQMIPNADCAIFVSDATATLSEPELNFVDMILRHCSQVLFVLTRIDLVPNYRQVMENNREKLAKVMKKSVEEIQIIPVSSRMKLMYKDTGDEDDLEDSNFAAFEASMNDILMDKRVHLIQAAALEGVRGLLAKATEPLLAQFRAFQADTKQRQEELQQEYVDRNRRLKELQQENAEWMSQLLQGHQDIKRNVNAEFEQRYLTIQDNFANKYLQDDALLQKPDEIGIRLQAELQALAKHTVAGINERAQKLHSQIIELTGLQLCEASAAVDWAPDKVKVQVGGIKKSDVKKKVFSAAKGFMAGGSVGGYILGAAGFLAGIAVSVPVLVAAGIAGGSYQAYQEWQNLKEKDSAAAAKVLREGYSSWMNQSRASLRQKIDDELVKLERQMRDGLKKEIKDQIKVCAEAIHNIQSAQQMTKEEVAAQGNRTKEILQEIGKLDQAAQRLTTAS